MRTARRPAARSIAAVALLALAVGALAACAPAAEGDDSFTIFATTGYLADAATNIAPAAQVTTMVGPGGDPHTYQPSTSDIEAILNADAVLWNGLQLEAQMADALASLGDRQLAAAEQLPRELLIALESGGGEPIYDPHVWNSPEAWMTVVHAIADHLSRLDPGGAHEYRANAAAYAGRIGEAAAEAERLLAGVPVPRTLITGHDAFAYFGDTYDLEVHATDFVSTEAQLSPARLSELADLIAEHRVPVVFHDDQVNPQAITSLQEAVRARGAAVDVASEPLYADSLGAEAGVDTYLGAFQHNVRVIAEALGGEQS